jgi:hypothetical protein
MSRWSDDQPACVVAILRDVEDAPSESILKQTKAVLQHNGIKCADDTKSSPMFSKALPMYLEVCGFWQMFLGKGSACDWRVVLDILQQNSRWYLDDATGDTVGHLTADDKPKFGRCFPYHESLCIRTTEFEAGLAKSLFMVCQLPIFSTDSALHIRNTGHAFGEAVESAFSNQLKDYKINRVLFVGCNKSVTSAGTGADTKVLLSIIKKVFESYEIKKESHNVALFMNGLSKPKKGFLGRDPLRTVTDSVQYWHISFTDGTASNSVTDALDKTTPVDVILLEPFYCSALSIGLCDGVWNLHAKSDNVESKGVKLFGGT